MQRGKKQHFQRWKPLGAFFYVGNKGAWLYTTKEKYPGSFLSKPSDIWHDYHQVGDDELSLFLMFNNYKSNIAHV